MVLTSGVLLFVADDHGVSAEQISEALAALDIPPSNGMLELVPELGRSLVANHLQCFSCHPRYRPHKCLN